ncbi:hypothetical protein [Roseibium sp. SCP14]|uniref:hypothetical protein n=1 Tax=Roseibium sp. SCP14 TaxID=3141375 RepID=UPI00333A10F9
MKLAGGWGVELYDHKEKIAWWMRADFLLRELILPGLVLTLVVGSNVLYRIDTVEVLAVATRVEQRCTASKTHWDRRSVLFRKTDTRSIDCALIGTSVAEQLEDDGFRLAETTRVWFSYRSPEDSKMQQGLSEVNTSDFSVGDVIKIEVSHKWPHVVDIVQ